MQIVSKTRIVEQTWHMRHFAWADQLGAGFSFDCDADGVVDVAKLNPVAARSYAACLTGTVDGRKILDKGVRTSTTRYREPAVGRCDCGTLVSLGGFTNTCEGCGADYNASGMRLAPRACWGEETGEHPADIARIP